MLKGKLVKKTIFQIQYNFIQDYKLIDKDIEDEYRIDFTRESFQTSRV
jgi:hypothetical protein